jgi:simple sugar transport system substrate-binding protein
MQAERWRPVLGLALLAVGCGGEASSERALPVTPVAPAAARALVVGFSQIGAESAWRAAETESIRSEAARRGIELKLADAQGKLENQIQALHAFLVQKVDAVLLAPQKESGFGPVLKELKAAHIPVVLVDRGVDADPELYATLIASDFVAEGRMAAEWLLEHTPFAHGDAKVRIVEIEGTAGSAPAIDRKRGFDEKIAKVPRFQIVRSQNGQFELPKGKEVMEAILRAESNKVDAVYAHNDDMALGAIQALEAAGLHPGQDVLVISIDATRGALEAIATGKLSASVECSPLLGPLAFDAVQAIARGEKVEKRVLVRDQIFDASNAAAELPSRRY